MHMAHAHEIKLIFIFKGVYLSVKGDTDWKRVDKQAGSEKVEGVSS